MKLLLLKHAWSIHVNLDPESVKCVLRSEFYKNWKFDGIVNYQSFSFIYNSIPKTFRNISLVGFDGEISENETGSRIDLYCGVVNIVLVIYWLAAISVSIGILFNMEGMDISNFIFMPERIWIALLIPLVTYTIIFLPYLAVLKEGKSAINNVFAAYIVNKNS